jgi:hypothetical protein
MHRSKNAVVLTVFKGTIARDYYFSNSCKSAPQWASHLDFQTILFFRIREDIRKRKENKWYLRQRWHNYKLKLGDKIDIVSNSLLCRMENRCTSGLSTARFRQSYVFLCMSYSIEIILWNYTELRNGVGSTARGCHWNSLTAHGGDKKKELITSVDWSYSLV